MNPKSTDSVSISNGDIVLDCTFRGSRATSTGTHIACVKLPDESVVEAWASDQPLTLKRGDSVDVQYWNKAYHLYSY